MATDNLTEDQVRMFVREEWARLDAKKTLETQAACKHARSGTIHDGVVICDDCRKQLTLDDVHYNDNTGGLGVLEQKRIDDMRRPR